MNGLCKESQGKLLQRYICSVTSSPEDTKENISPVWLKPDLWVRGSAVSGESSQLLYSLVCKYCHVWDLIHRTKDPVISSNTRVRRRIPSCVLWGRFLLDSQNLHHLPLPPKSWDSRYVPLLLSLPISYLFPCVHCGPGYMVGACD